MRSVAIGVACLAAFLAGCGQTNFPDAFNTNLNDTNRIINDTRLMNNQKREQLAALGISESTINALLRDVRTANQFGGTLETAFTKVKAGQFTALTPDEIQLYGDATNETTFSDAQAQSLALFFADTAIHTAEQLKSFLDTPGNELPAGLDATDVRAVFVDFNPDDVLSNLP